MTDSQKETEYQKMSSAEQHANNNHHSIQESTGKQNCLTDQYTQTNQHQQYESIAVSSTNGANDNLEIYRSLDFYGDLTELGFGSK